MRFCFVLLFLFGIPAFSQITPAQQKALNNYVDYANKSADEVTAVLQRVMEYYPTLFEKNSWRAPNFVCPIQPEDYFLNKAQQDSKVLGASAASMNDALKTLAAAAEKIDATCKALDTYHKLEDYKQDNYAKAYALITTLQQDVERYQQKKLAFKGVLERIYKKLNPSPTSSYAKADALMRKQIEREQAFIELWKYNLKADVHSGWITEALSASILETDARVAELMKIKPTLKYPASSMWPSFLEALQAMLDIKRRGLDEYNNEAKKNDEHSNDVYLDLINYFNGALVAHYNAFIGYAEDYGLKAIKIVPSVEVRTQPIAKQPEVTPFKDLPYTPVTVSIQKTAIPKPVFASLNHYVEFINETWRQVSNKHMAMNNFSSSASYFKDLTSYEGRGRLTYDDDDFVIPRSYHQKAVAESKSLSPSQASSLNTQTDVILNILQEMEQLDAVMALEVKERLYEKDQLKRLYTFIERYEVLFEAWDERKENLYNDVRKIYEAYKSPAQPGSWEVSGKALQALTDLDHDALFKAKAFYKGTGSEDIPTDKIDAAVREVIANEYTNMKGIEKIGRSNGLCPYTPYEDLPVRSKQLSELLKKLPAAKQTDHVYSHPYHSMVYAYNDVVEKWNKFCSLSPMPLLPTVMQPELFPPKGQDKRTTKTVSDVPATPATPAISSVKPPQTQQPVNTASTKVIHDTVYIEKRDTVYLSGDEDDIRSMEGYAPNNMVLLLDVSASMNAPEKLPLLKQSITNMLSMMRREDEVSILIFSGKPKVLLAPSSFKEESKIIEAINTLKPSGKTDGNAGIKLAYKIADDNYIRGGNNRIILATDGEFPVSEETTKLIEKFAGQDIFLSVFNFGKTTASMRSLEKLALTGKGNYEHISKENAGIKLVREAKAKKR